MDLAFPNLVLEDTLRWMALYFPVGLFSSFILWAMEMTSTEKKLVGWIKQIGADRGQLDLLVEDIKCQQANRLNNKGVVAQIQYLLKFRTPEEICEMVDHEMRILRRYHMKLQSKTKPERNRKLKGRALQKPTKNL